MSQDTADFSGTTGASVVFMFTPQSDGVAFFSGASLTEESTGKHTALTVTDNTTTFNLPQGDSFVQLAIVDGPDPETGTVSCTIDGANSVLWPGKPLFRTPGAFFGFGE